MAAGQLLGTGDDVLTQFQLVKHYPSESARSAFHRSHLQPEPGLSGVAATLASSDG
jgi:hypothetical protein